MTVLTLAVTLLAVYVLGRSHGGRAERNRAAESRPVPLLEALAERGRLVETPLVPPPPVIDLDAYRDDEPFRPSLLDVTWAAWLPPAHGLLWRVGEKFDRLAVGSLRLAALCDWLGAHERHWWRDEPLVVGRHAAPAPLALSPAPAPVVDERPRCLAADWRAGIAEIPIAELGATWRPAKPDLDETHGQLTPQLDERELVGATA